jgi:hypothetical protein
MKDSPLGLFPGSRRMTGPRERRIEEVPGFD